MILGREHREGGLDTRTASARRLEKRQGEWSKIHALRKRQCRGKAEVGGDAGRTLGWTLLLFWGESSRPDHSQTHIHTCTHKHNTITHAHSHPVMHIKPRLTTHTHTHTESTLTTHILLPTHAHNSHIHITHVCTHTHTCTHNNSQSSCSYLWSPAFPSCSARSSQASSDNLPLTLCRKTPSCACHSPMSSAIWL